MNTAAKMNKFLVCALSAAAIAISNAALADRNFLPVQATARNAMVKTLGAANAGVSMGDEASTFGRFVGAWDVDYTFYRDNGRIVHKKGELLFGWVLDGNALQDIWITYPAQGEKERKLGTSVRFFDSALKRWRVVFVSPQFNYLVTVQGGLEGKRIVLTGIDSDGAPIRWSFNDIKPGSFVFHGEKSHDGGKTWRLEEEHHMTRRDPAATSATEQARD
jgi:hypothetical protein